MSEDQSSKPSRRVQIALWVTSVITFGVAAPFALWHTLGRRFTGRSITGLAVASLAIIMLVGSIGADETTNGDGQDAEPEKTDTVRASEDDAESEADDAASKKAAAAKKLEKRRRDFTAYYTVLVDQSSVSDAIMGRYDDEVIPAVEQGNLVKAYQVAEGMGRAQGLVQDEIADLKTPKSLTKKHREALNQATTDAQAGALYRIDGLKKVREFLDDQKPSAMSEATDEIEKANAAWLSALAGAGIVGTELGVDVAKLMPK